VLSAMASNDPEVFQEFRDALAVVSVVWSPDGKRIASASVDQTVQVWVAS